MFSLMVSRVGGATVSRRRRVRASWCSTSSWSRRPRTWNRELELTLVGDESERESEQHHDRTERSGDAGPVGDHTDDRPTPRVEQQSTKGLAPEQRLRLARECGVLRVRLRRRAHLRVRLAVRDALQVDLDELVRVRLGLRAVVDGLAGVALEAGELLGVEPGAALRRELDLLLRQLGVHHVVREARSPTAAGRCPTDRTRNRTLPMMTSVGTVVIHFFRRIAHLLESGPGEPPGAVHRRLPSARVAEAIRREGRGLRSPARRASDSRSHSVRSVPSAGAGRTRCVSGAVPKEERCQRRRPRARPDGRTRPGERNSPTASGCPPLPRW